MLPAPMAELRYYIDTEGKQPFARWFDDLDASVAAKITVALARMEQGNFSNVEPVGEGVSEYKLDFGPGYRIYYGKDGEELVILLTGGTKKRQDNDIATAKSYWQDYKRRTKQLAKKDGVKNGKKRKL